LAIEKAALKTDVFRKHVKSIGSGDLSKMTADTVNGGIFTALMVALGFADEVVQGAAGAAAVGSRALATTAALGTGVILSIGIGVWSAKNAQQHIFSHINGDCDDLILLSILLIQ
jgi:hypothetical protein